MPVNDSQRILFDEARKVQKEVENKNDSSQIKVRLEIYNVGLSKSKRILNGLKSGAYQLFLVEDFKDWGTAKGVKVLKSIEKNFDSKQAKVINETMYASLVCIMA